MSAEDYIGFDACMEEATDGYGRRQVGYFNPLPSAPNNGRAWHTDDEEELERLWDRGYGLDACAKKFGRTKVAIIARLEKLGLDVNQNNASLPAKKTTTKEPMMQNFQHLLALLQKNYTTVAVRFRDNGTGNTQGADTYTYKVPLSLEVAKGDLLVVPARKFFSVVEVVEVHDTPQIDVKKPLALRWIVQKVDTAAYDDQTAREEQAIKQVEVAERRRAQEEALQTLLGSAEDREAFLALINAPK